MKLITALCLMLCTTTSLRAAEPVPQADDSLLEEHYKKCMNTVESNRACLKAGDLYVSAWEKNGMDALLARAILIYQRVCSNQRYVEDQMPDWAEPLPNPSCAKAISITERGAAAGSRDSTYARAELALEARDFDDASKWLRRAADQDQVDAILKLGDLLYEGIYVPKDVDAALTWYARAATLRSDEAINRLAGHWEIVGQFSFERPSLELAMAHLTRLRPERPPLDFRTGQHLAYLDFRDENMAWRGHAPFAFERKFCAPGVFLGNSRRWNIYLLPRPEDFSEALEDLPQIAEGEADKAACIRFDDRTRAKLSTAFQQGLTPMLDLAGNYFILKPGAARGQIHSLLALKMFR